MRSMIIVVFRYGSGSLWVRFFIFLFLLCRFVLEAGFFL